MGNHILEKLSINKNFVLSIGHNTYKNTTKNKSTFKKNFVKK